MISLDKFSTVWYWFSSHKHTHTPNCETKSQLFNCFQFILLSIIINYSKHSGTEILTDSLILLIASLSPWQEETEETSQQMAAQYSYTSQTTQRAILVILGAMFALPISAFDLFTIYMIYIDIRYMWSDVICIAGYRSAWPSSRERKFGYPERSVSTWRLGSPSSRSTGGPRWTQKEYWKKYGKHQNIWKNQSQSHANTISTIYYQCQGNRKLNGTGSEVDVPNGFDKTHKKTRLNYSLYLL